MAKSSQGVLNLDHSLNLSATCKRHRFIKIRCQIPLSNIPKSVLRMETM